MPHDLNEKLSEVFAAKWQAENHPHYADMLDKFLFHMSDASQDIRQVAGLLQHPDAVDCATFGKLLHRFFLHALPHLVAAGQLYDFVPEMFPEQRGVHSIEGDEADQDTRNGDGTETCVSPFVDSCPTPPSDDRS
jgi:hypothetical protein